jgi:ferritin-like metal-binding protein YciE
VANKVRSQQLSALVEKWIEDTKPKVDPWEWLNDVYGKEDAIKQALSMVSIDYDKAAADAVNTDGWSHFISSWDRNSIDLANGAVACRIA